jgi:hypothetical protein
MRVEFTTGLWGFPMPRFAFFARSFVHSETGAVTVDWTVLAAALCGLGLASAAAVRSGVGDLGADIDSSLSGANVAALSFGGEGGASWDRLFYTEDRYAELVDLFATYDPATLADTFSDYLLAVDYQLSIGDTGAASTYLDAAAASLEALEASGHGTSDQADALRTALASYRAATA